jgi:hypothetical protein
MHAPHLCRVPHVAGAEGEVLQKHQLGKALRRLVRAADGGIDIGHRMNAKGFFVSCEFWMDV